ncbi:MAG: XrtA/PEP-CTERM system-associated ATPase [Burkholderiaceae bacterium]
MYESHFGFSGSPFQLNPDPAFYFDSRGHSNALAYLKFGAHQGEGFIVVTGEIGAGKTTLVRTLLAGLDPTKVVAAQVVSTQLESSELLQAILIAFGIASNNPSKAHLIASLEAYLTAMAAQGRRALLIIDEAQNLKHEAVEELRMLSNFQLGNHGLLQSFLVGQPELRSLLQSKSMEQLRQRVIASCHLGPLDQAETRAYVEHRLHRVGWRGVSPGLAPGSLDRVHEWTGGVPRRINRLCNRLLLSAFLSGARAVTVAMVDDTALELKGEIGEAITGPVPLDAPLTPAKSTPAGTERRPAGQLDVAAPSQSASSPAHGPDIAVVTKSKPFTAADSSVTVPAAPIRVGAPGSRPETPVPPVPAAEVGSVRRRTPVPVRRIHRHVEFHRPILCLVGSASDYLKAGVLAGAFEGFPSLPRIVAVHIGAEADLELDDLDKMRMPLPALGLHLGIAPESFAIHVSHLLPVFDALLTEIQPHAVMVMGSSDADLACSLLTRRRGVRLLRTVSGQRDTAHEIGAGSNAILIDKNADLLFTDSMETFYALYREGVRLDRVHSVGNLGREMLAMALSHGHGSRAAIGPLLGIDASVLAEPYGMVAIDPQIGPDQGVDLVRCVDRLATLSRELPLLWPMRPTAFHQFEASDLATRIEGLRVTPVLSAGFGQMLALLRNSKRLVTLPGGRWLEESKFLGISSLELAADASIKALEATGRTQGSAVENRKVHDLIAIEGSNSQPALYWDAGTATRIARHLIHWLSAPARDSEPGRTDLPALTAAH